METPGFSHFPHCCCSGKDDNNGALRAMCHRCATADNHSDKGRKAREVAGQSRPREQAASHRMAGVRRFPNDPKWRWKLRERPPRPRFSGLFVAANVSAEPRVRCAWSNDNLAYLRSQIHESIKNDSRSRLHVLTLFMVCMLNIDPVSYECAIVQVESNSIH